MRKINYIVVHCSATREGCTLTSEALEAEHRRRGFRTTGYHYYIRRDGTVLVLWANDNTEKQKHNKRKNIRFIAIYF